MAASKKSVVASGKRGRDEEADAAKGLTGHAIFSSCGQFVIAGDASGVLTVFDAETRAVRQRVSVHAFTSL